MKSIPILSGEYPEEYVLDIYGIDLFCCIASTLGISTKYRLPVKEDKSKISIFYSNNFIVYQRCQFD